MNEDIRKRKAELLFYSITPENVEQIYERNFKRYLIENSDEVEINGNVYSNSLEDQQMKRMFILTNEQNTINKAKTCNTKGGFPLTEASFIKNQLTILKDLSFIDFVQTMKYETYLNFILNKKNPPQPDPILNEKKPFQNLEKFKLICKAICSDLESNRSDKSKIQTILHENSDDLHSNVFYAVIEIKRLHYSERKDIAKYYLGDAKKYKNEVTELLNEAIEQNILVRYDKNLFYKDFFGYLNYFIDEVERFTGHSESEPQQIVKQKPKLKIDQIALKFVYEKTQITRENGNKFAKEYGHNSGEKLFQRFTYFSSLANRKGIPNHCTAKKLDNKIKLIESVIEILSIEKQKQAKDEVSILKTIYESEYL